MESFVLIIILSIFNGNWTTFNKEVITLENGFQFSEVTNLPSILAESSGLETASSNEFWSFNDSKGKAALYKFNAQGTLLHTLNISNATNIDWEDMTKDGQGNVYVGDFGNNDNERKDLVIYKIKSTDLKGNQLTVSAEKIAFKFPDQTAFPPPRSNRFYDIEAMFAKDAHLYMLIRDRSKPFVGKTRLYRVPGSPGDYTAEFLEEFMTDTEKKKGQITAADLSEDGTKLAMLAKEAVWLFHLNSGGRILTDNFERMSLKEDLGAEGIVIKDDCTVYITNEAKKERPAALYRLDTCP